MHRKLLVIPLALAVWSVALATAAQGNRLSFSENRFRVTYSPLSVIPTFGSTVRCSVTLEGSYHSRTITKTSTSLIGWVTSAAVGACEAGRMRVNTETLPWHVRYLTFNGTLPNITAIRKEGAVSFEVAGEIFGLRVICRYSEAIELFGDERESFGRGTMTNERPGGQLIGSETSPCPDVQLSGTGSITTPAGAAIVLSLI